MTWNNTEVTKLLNIKYPILLGPFGRGASSAQLTAAVSNAGGLGSYGCNTLDPQQITQVASEIRTLTDKPFGMNLWVSTFDEGGDSLDDETYERILEFLLPYYKELNVPPPARPTAKAKNFDEQVEALIEAKPAFFSFIFGVPSASVLQKCKANGIVTAGGATSIDEAVALEKAGVDIVVASGFEAAGHRPAFLDRANDSFIGSFALIPQIADAVKIPVVAAGGISDGRGVAAALILGADAVQVGTAFLACDESGAFQGHRQLLFQEEAKYSNLTRAFTGRFARGLSNRFAREMKPHEFEIAKYPAMSWIVAPLSAAAVAQGRSDLIALWAGQAAPLVRHHKAAELFDSLVQETNGIFLDKNLG